MIQLVSYVTGLKLRSLRTGKSYRRRTTGDVVRFDCVGSELPMQVLWSKAESAEKRKNSIEGRHQIVALPRENSREEQWRMLMAMAEEINRLLGVPVVVALHDNDDEKDKPRNPHGHLVFATRVWNERIHSFLGKTRQLDVATTGSAIIEGFRKKWEDIVNADLPPGVKKVSRLSHARAGRNRIPRRHLGEEAMEMERKGIRTRHGNFNRKVDQLDRVTARRTKVENLLKPTPKLSLTERQREIGLERELAIANAAIASMPPVRKNAPVEVKVSAIDVVDQADFVTTQQAITEPPAETPTKRTQTLAPLGPRDALSTTTEVVLETGGSAAELIPRPLEEDISLSFEAIGAMPPKDLSTP